MFGLIGLVIGLVFGTSKFAVRNAVRAAAFGLVGYLVYELIVGYTQGRATAEVLSASPAPAQAPPDASRSPLTGAAKQGRTIHVSDASGVERTARVGRGVVHR